MLLAMWRRQRPRRHGLFADLRLADALLGSEPRFRVLEPGPPRSRFRDCRANQQQQGSVHAIAQLNHAEQASGLPLLTGLPEDARGIVTHISMQYLKKARGTIRRYAMSAHHRSCRTDLDVTAECLDADRDVVARATVRWRLGRAR